MIWNEQEEQYFFRFIESYIAANNKEGLNTEEFKIDIKSHIEENCREQKLNVITEQDVRKNLEKMGFENLEVLKSKVKRLEKRSFFNFSSTTKNFFLVILPPICAIVAWGMVQNKGPASGNFNKTLLICVFLSGIINAFLLHINNKNKFEKQKVFFYLLYFNLFLYLYYMICFIPMVPFSFFLIIAFGFGLLILDPYINFLILFRLGKEFKNKLKEENLYVEKGYKKTGFFAFLGIFVVSHLFDIASLLSYQLYESNNHVTKNLGISILRNLGSKHYKPATLGEGIWYIHKEASDEFIYKAYGKTKSNLNDWRIRIDDDDFFEENNINNSDEFIGRNTKTIKLQSSEIDGSVNLENGICYLEWTMVFHNSSSNNGEARAVIKLPPDAVVSRLTLWVNGEEQEAAFAKHSVVEEAYNSVVNKNRDPVLVQYKSPDTVTMKCFPVSKMTPMKIRIGITAPVQYISNNKAYVKTPYLLKNNFQIDSSLIHYVWLESKQSLEYKDKIALKIEDAYKLKIKMNNKELEEGEPFYFSNIPSNTTSYVYPLTESQFLTSKVTEEKPKEIEKIILVVDFGAMIKNEFHYFEEALDKLPTDKEIIVYCIGDKIKKFTYTKKTGSLDDLKSEVLKYKNEFGLVGGHDFVPVLVEALDEYDFDEKVLYIWVHGDISYALSNPEPLEKILLRSPKKPNLIEFGTTKSTNILTTKSKELANFPQGKGAYLGLKNLSEFFRSINNPTTKIIFDVKENINTSEYQEGNKHLARIWANQEIIKMGLLKELDINKAISLSATYQLVTPYVGAVVLENKSQYDQFNLKQVDASTVPSIPEPEEWALIIVIIIMLLYILKVKKFGKPRHA
jgi:hypothetical protein